MTSAENEILGQIISFQSPWYKLCSQISVFCVLINEIKMDYTTMRYKAKKFSHTTTYY